MRLSWRKTILRISKGEGVSGKETLENSEIKGGRRFFLNNSPLFDILEIENGFIIRVFNMDFFGNQALNGSIALFYSRDKTIGIYSPHAKIERIDKEKYFFNARCIKISHDKSPNSVVKKLLERRCDPRILGKVLDGRNMTDSEILRESEGYEAVVANRRKIANWDFLEQELSEKNILLVKDSDVIFTDDTLRSLLSIGKKIPIGKFHDITLRWNTYRNCESIGYPLKPLFFEFKDDGVDAIVDEYLLGDLLIAPDLRDFGKRWIFLPNSNWIDLDTLSNYSGGWIFLEGKHTFLKEGGYAQIEHDDHIEIVANKRAFGDIFQFGCKKEFEISDDRLILRESRGCKKKEIVFKIFRDSKLVELSVSAGDKEKEVRV